MPKLVLVVPEYSSTPKGGPQLRISNTISAMCAIGGLEIHVVVTGALEEEPLIQGEQKSRVTGWHFTLRDPNRRSSLSALRAMRAATSRIFVLDRKIRGLDPDVIWFSFSVLHFPNLLLTKLHRRPAFVVSDNDSVWSRFLLRGVPFSTGRTRLVLFVKGTLSVLKELAIANLSSINAAPSPFDAEYYRAISLGKKDAAVVSNVLDLRDYPETSNHIDADGTSLVIPGSFGFTGSPMEDGVTWFLGEIWPAIKLEFPEARLLIAGRHSNARFQSDPIAGIEVLGTVENMVEIIGSATACVVPLRFESGTRFKILEAGAVGVPVISTRMGAEGLPVTNGRDIFLADTPEEFLMAMRALGQPNVGKNLGQTLQGLVRGQFGTANLSAQIKAVLVRLGVYP